MKIFNVLIACFIIFIFFILSFFERKIKHENKKKIIFFFTIVISVFMAFRNIGLDLDPYRKIFEDNDVVEFNFQFIKHMFSGSLEPMFVILISSLKSIGLGFRSFLFVSAIVPLYIIYRIIVKKENEIPLITYFIFLLLLLFTGPINIIRHFFAAAIYLSALYSLSLNNTIKFYTKSLFSVLVHYSNIAIIPLRPLLGIKWTLRKYLLSFILLCLSTIVIKPIIVNFGLNVNTRISLLLKFKYYLIYYNSSDYRYLNELHRVLLFLMSYYVVAFNIFIILFALRFRKLIEEDKFYKLLLNSQIIGSFMIAFFTIFDASTLGLRLNFLFSIGSFLLVKEVIFNYFKGDRKTLYIFIVLSLVIYNFIILLYYAGIHDPNSQFYIL